jgi:hypothetical protein
MQPTGPGSVGDAGQSPDAMTPRVDGGSAAGSGASAGGAGGAAGAGGGAGQGDSGGDCPDAGAADAGSAPCADEDAGALR